MFESISNLGEAFKLFGKDEESWVDLRKHK